MTRGRPNLAVAAANKHTVSIGSAVAPTEAHKGLHRCIGSVQPNFPHNIEMPVPFAARGRCLARERPNMAVAAADKHTASIRSAVAHTEAYEGLHRCA